MHDLRQVIWHERPKHKLAGGLGEDALSSEAAALGSSPVGQCKVDSGHQHQPAPIARTTKIAMRSVPLTSSANVFPVGQRVGVQQSRRVIMVVICGVAHATLIRSLDHCYCSPNSTGLISAG